jgi:hypothetical protein
MYPFQLPCDEPQPDGSARRAVVVDAVGRDQRPHRETSPDLGQLDQLDRLAEVVLGYSPTKSQWMTRM